MVSGRVVDVQRIDRRLISRTRVGQVRLDGLLARVHSRRRGIFERRKPDAGFGRVFEQAVVGDVIVVVGKRSALCVNAVGRPEATGWGVAASGADRVMFYLYAEEVADEDEQSDGQSQLE